MLVNLSEDDMQHIEENLAAYTRLNCFWKTKDGAAWKSKTGAIRRKFTEAKQQQVQQGQEG